VRSSTAVDVTCAVCETPFKIWQSRALKNKVHCCSRACSGIKYSLRASQKVTVSCVICKKELKYKQSAIKQIANPTCSYLCNRAMSRIRNAGTSNPKALRLSLYDRHFWDRAKSLSLRGLSKGFLSSITWVELKQIYEKQEGLCYYTKIPIHIDGPKSYNTASVDRLDSTKGYNLDNIVYCALSINMMKSNFSLDNVHTLFEAMYKKEHCMKMKIKCLYPDSIFPTQGSKYAAGLDLYCHRIEDYGTYIKIFTGVAVQPMGHFWSILAARSSIYKWGLSLYNSLGIIDMDFTGELSAICTKHENYIEPKPGERLLQLVAQEMIYIEPVLVEEFIATERGEKGFGSTSQS
jgi:dUTP pyrophosphatase